VKGVQAHRRFPLVIGVASALAACGPSDQPSASGSTSIDAGPRPVSCASPDGAASVPLDDYSVSPDAARDLVSNEDGGVIVDPGGSDVRSVWVNIAVSDDTVAAAGGSVSGVALCVRPSAAGQQVHVRFAAAENPDNAYRRFVTEAQPALLTADFDGPAGETDVALLVRLPDIAAPIAIEAAFVY